MPRYYFGLRGVMAPGCCGEVVWQKKVVWGGSFLGLCCKVVADAGCVTLFPPESCVGMARLAVALTQSLGEIEGAWKLDSEPNRCLMMVVWCLGHGCAQGAAWPARRSWAGEQQLWLNAQVLRLWCCKRCCVWAGLSAGRHSGQFTGLPAMGEDWAAVMCLVLSACFSAAGGGREHSGTDKGFGENVSGEERLMDLGSSSGNTYVLLEL